MGTSYRTPSYGEETTVIRFRAEHESFHKIFRTEETVEFEIILHTREEHELEMFITEGILKLCETHSPR